MNIKKTNLRFNLDKESDKKAYDFLQSLDKNSYKSVNRFVIYLVNDYADNKHRERAESQLTEKIVSAIREELKAFAPMQLFQFLGQMQSTTPKEQNSAETEDEMINFLLSLGGKE
jgi:hypothetical protein